MRRSATHAHTQNGGAGRRRPGLRKPLWLLLKAVFVAVLLLALGRHVLTLSREWSEHGMTSIGSSLDVYWIGVAIAAFLGSQLLFSAYWRRLLACSGVVALRLATLRAYAVGTLGKYIPGKAFVVLIRTGFVQSPGASRFAIGLTVVYETVSTLAVGAAVAGACFLFVSAQQWVYWAGAATLAAALVVVLHPAVFGRVSKLAAVPFRNTGSTFPVKACFSAFFRWSPVPIAAWLLQGVSYWAVFKAVGISGNSLDELTLLTGTAALATALGFVVLFIPAGLGVRELVMIQILAARYGASEVVVASLVLRTIWTLGEALLAGTLYWIRPTAGNVAEDVAQENDSKAAISLEGSTPC